ncbi:MAG: FixH family protein [Burkholderiaceae bacterium]|nr:FixH family protein [Burkholderiaceae bacterium]
MIRSLAWAPAIAGLCGAGAAAAACGDALPAAARLQAEATGWQLAFAPRPAPLAVGRPFALDIVVCPPAGQPLPATLKVDAEMPAHRHGMNYRASVKPLGSGRWQAEGLMFHMPGRWRVLFDLDRPGQPPLRLASELDLP